MSKIVFTGGGTLGHVMPNIYLIDELKKDNEIFITRRGYGEFVDMWEFPGGKIEEGESREEAE